MVSTINQVKNRYKIMTFIYSVESSMCCEAGLAEAVVEVGEQLSVLAGGVRCATVRTLQDTLIEYVVDFSGRRGSILNR